MPICQHVNYPRNNVSHADTPVFVSVVIGRKKKAASRDVHARAQPERQIRAEHIFPISYFIILPIDRNQYWSIEKHYLL